MKAYVLTTGVIFGLLTLTHLWRMVEEGTRLMTSVVFVSITALSAVFCVWAAALIVGSRRR